MANPYHHTAKHTAKAKMKAIHREHHHVHHDDAAQDRAMIKGAIRHHEHKAHGMKSGGRLDRGKHRKVKISIEKSAPAGDPMAALGAQPGAAPPPTAMPPPGMSSGPMPAPPGPMGMQKKGGRVKRAKGGRVYTEGESSKPNLKAWAGYASKNSYAKGGRIGKYPLTAGADTGEGRLEHSRAAKRKYP